MIRSTGKSQISRRGGRQSQFSNKTSSRLNPDRQETTLAQEDPTAPGRNCPLSPPPASRIAGTTMETEIENMKEAILEPRKYPNEYEEPDPLTPDITVDGQEGHRRVVTALGDKTYDVFSSGNSAGVELLTDVISAFRPHYLQT